MMKFTMSSFSLPIFVILYRTAVDAFQPLKTLQYSLISPPSLMALPPVSLNVRQEWSSTRLFQSSDPLGPGHIATTAKPRKKNLKTFNRYLEVECWKRSELRDLERVLQAVSDACKQINRIVQRAQTDDLYGVALGMDGKPMEETNVQGEVQQQLDVLCNTIMLRAFCGCSNSICAVASEEEDEPRSCADVMVSIFRFIHFAVHSSFLTNHHLE